MNEILINTHIKENIDLLKARDFFFDKARSRYKWYELSIIIPPLIAGTSYIPMITKVFPFINDYRDHIVGICTILFVLIGEIILKMNSSDLAVSNALREEYDVKVFGIERNPFIISQNLLKTPDDKWNPEIVKAWNSRQDTPKYEAWYQEAFCDSKHRNILCLQMDNIIYTYHIYNAYRKRLNSYLVISIISIISLLVCSIFVWNNIQVFFLIMFSMFGALQYQIGNIKTINDLLSSINHIYISVLSDNIELSEQLDDESVSSTLLRTIQDVVINIRDKSLFVPKSIRNRYLKNGNPYYRQLDYIKQKYMINPYIPATDEEIDILSDRGANISTNMAGLHRRLFEMLKDIDAVFRKEKIEYMLDGGSLIGACRSEKGFVFWDDDIDIALIIDDIEQAKQAVRKYLGDKYVIQDYTNEEAYSPRLSNFRIREKTGSILVEKDSELNELYNSRGLFVDVYAYSPIVCNKSIDSLMRRILIQGFRFRPKDLPCFRNFYNHIKKQENFIWIRERMENVIGIKGLYERIRKTESDWKYKGDNRENWNKRLKYYKQFQKLKQKYLKRVEIYYKMAKNTKYYCYTPNYIDDICRPGPYIERSAILEKDEIDFNFEGTSLKVMIPKGYDTVLNAYYGNWQKSPFVELESLKNDGRYEFSSKRFDATVLKHLKYINQF